MEPEESEAERPEKRRKLRKGTHSCWECKRRKIRCTYASPEDAVCIGCTRRATACVSQELPEQIAPPGSQSRLVGDRFVRVEQMVERLTKQAAGQLSPPSRSNTYDKGDAAYAHGSLTPVSCNNTPGPHSTSQPTPTAQNSDSFLVSLPTPPGCPYASGNNDADQQALSADGPTSKLSEALLAAYPSWHDVEIIVNNAGSVASHFIAMAMADRVPPEERARTLRSLKVRHTAASHPIFITRQMLMLAVTTQFISPELDQERLGLSESLFIMRQRWVGTASRLSLATHDITDTGTLEGLECIVYDGLFQANMGNLRQAWLAWRRAIGTAQLMGLSRPYRTSVKTMNSSRKVNAAYIWYRLLMVDRYLCLFLGLPQASTDQSMVSEANLSKVSLESQFERRQCVIAGRIVDRNESDPSAADHAETRAIDEMLQEAASKMPSRWWLLPNLAGINDEELLLEEISRLQKQMTHYNLLNLLHLPYILHSTAPPSTDREFCTHHYSRLTCVNASRDLLKSYIMFRHWNRIACCCRIMDYFALMASMTLLVAHIDSHSMMRERRASPNKALERPAIDILAHQRITDRAMMEEALDSMSAVATLNDDAFNTKSADLLRQLLAIEEEAANPSASVSSGKHVLRMDVPHMGTVTIGANGATRKDAHSAAQDQSRTLVTHHFPAGTSTGVRGRRNTVDLETNKNMRDEAPQAQQTYSTATTSQAQDTTTTGVAAEMQALQAPVASLSTHVPPSLATTTPPTVMRLSGGADGLGQNPPQFMNNAPSRELAQVNALQQPLPGLIAGAEQWAFQGVDMTFFNSLMRETELQAEGNTGQWWPMMDIPGNG